MDEYINRRELAERISKYVKSETPEEKELIEWCKDECIRQAYCMSTTDAVEVVRCKNCDYRDGIEDICGNIYCRLHDGRFDKDGYCSYGKRREEDV